MTKEVILGALERLNDKHSQTLLATARTVNVKMPQLQESPDDYIRSSTTFYCEDPRLSVPQTGTWIKALALDDAQVPFLSLDQLQDIIDFVAAFVDTDALVTTTYANFGKNSQTRKHSWSLKERGGRMLNELRPVVRPRRLERTIAHVDPQRKYVGLTAMSAA